MDCDFARKQQSWNSTYRVKVFFLSTHVRNVNNVYNVHRNKKKNICKRNEWKFAWSAPFTNFELCCNLFHDRQIKFTFENLFFFFCQSQLFFRTFSFLIFIWRTKQFQFYHKIWWNDMLLCFVLYALFIYIYTEIYSTHFARKLLHSLLWTHFWTIRTATNYRQWHKTRWLTSTWFSA